MFNLFAWIRTSISNAVVQGFKDGLDRVGMTIQVPEVDSALQEALAQSVGVPRPALTQKAPEEKAASNGHRKARV